LSKLAPDKQFDKIARSLAKFDQGDRIRLAMKVFDSEGVQLVLLTAKAIEEARQTLSKFGAELTELDVRNIENMNDALTKTQAVVGNLARIAIAELSLSLNALSRTLFDFGTEFMNVGLIIRLFLHELNDGIADLLGVFSTDLKTKFLDELQKLRTAATAARGGGPGGGGLDLPARTAQFKQVDLRRTALPFKMDPQTTEQRKQTTLLEKSVELQEKTVKELQNPKPVLLKAS